MSWFKQGLQIIVFISVLEACEDPMLQCGEPIGTKTKPAPLTAQEQKERDAYVKHMYGDTYKNKQYAEATKELLQNRNYTNGTFYGFYTDAAKQLVRTIWAKLKTLGFSGYDEAVLAGDVIACETPNLSLCYQSFADLSAAERAFHNQVFLQTNYDELYKAVKGLKFNNKYVIEVWCQTQEASPSELRLALSDVFRDGQSLYGSGLPDFDANQDTLISHEQTTEWNNVFIEAFRDDPFFKAYVERYEAKKREVKDVSTTLSLAGARKHKAGLNTSKLCVHNEWGSFTQTDMPVYVELTGDIHHNAECNLAAIVMYHLNGWMLGGIYGQSTSKLNTRFSAQGHELSAVLGYNMKNIFVETQVGGVWGKGMQGDVNGFRTQLRVGYDTEIISPFIEFGMKNIGHTKQVGKSVCVGCEMDILCSGNIHRKISSKLIAKLAVYNSEVRAKDLAGYINWVGMYHLNDADTVIAGLTLDHLSESKINIGFNVLR